MERDGNICMLGDEARVFRFHDAKVESQPFPHFTLPNFVPRHLGDAVLQWFETDAHWVPVGEGSTRRYIIHMQKQCSPAGLAFLTTPSFTSYLSEEVGKLFGTELSDQVDVSGLKLTPSYQIGVHTDFGSRGQTHRLLVPLNRMWVPEAGGLLLLLSSRSPQKLTENDKVIVPYHCGGIAFEISDKSFHAVTPVISGVRYTLCFYFFQR